MLFEDNPHSAQSNSAHGTRVSRAEMPGLQTAWNGSLWVTGTPTCWIRLACSEIGTLLCRILLLVSLNASGGHHDVG